MTATFANKTLTLTDRFLSSQSYYLDNGTWRKMPGMKTVSEPEATRLNSIYHGIMKRKANRGGRAKELR